MTCAGCQRPIESSFAFCPHCGTRQMTAQPAALTLDDVLDRWQLHLGHDYRDRDRDALGKTTAVYMLGVSETVVEAMRKLLPTYEFVERDRRPGVGDHADRLRVNIVPKTAASERRIASGKKSYGIFVAAIGHTPVNAYLGDTHLVPHQEAARRFASAQEAADEIKARGWVKQTGVLRAVPGKHTACVCTLPSLPSPLTPAEHQALQWFAYEHGRCWKRALRDEWMRACARVPMEVDGGRLPLRQLLQSLRNDADRFGPAGLIAYRLPAGFTFKARA